MSSKNGKKPKDDSAQIVALLQHGLDFAEVSPTSAEAKCMKGLEWRLRKYLEGGGDVLPFWLDRIQMLGAHLRVELKSIVGSLATHCDDSEEQWKEEDARRA